MLLLAVKYTKNMIQTNQATLKNLNQINLTNQSLKLMTCNQH